MLAIGVCLVVVELVTFLVPTRDVEASPAPRDGVLRSFDDHSAEVRVGLIHVRRGVTKMGCQAIGKFGKLRPVSFPEIPPFLVEAGN